jgi:hypothetical protein
MDGKVSKSRRRSLNPNEEFMWGIKIEIEP